MPGFTYLAVGYCEFFSDQVSDVLLLQSDECQLQVLVSAS